VKVRARERRLRRGIDAAERDDRRREIHMGSERSVCVPGCVTSGTRTTHGTCMISSYTNGPFDRRPCEPHMSPWSEVRITAVLSYWPVSSSAAMTVPSERSAICCSFT
jgi:hypothetical protein